MAELPESNIFRRGPISDLLKRQMLAAVDRVRRSGDEVFLKAADLALRLVEEYSFPIPKLGEPEMTWDSTRFNLREISPDPLQPRQVVDGVVIHVYYALEGFSEAIFYRPEKHFDPLPRGSADIEKVVCTWFATSTTDARTIKQSEVERDRLTLMVKRLGEDLTRFNAELATEIHNEIDRLAGLEQGASAWGLRIRKNAPETYNVPSSSVQLKLKGRSEAALTLREDHYEHILKVCGNMAEVMERSPTAFKRITEQNLRIHFLVQLNAQFEGGATAETFNLGGKTDIRIHWEGNVLFIAECKYWNGEASYSATIDQLLDYVTWRDTKTAILVFNTNKDFTNVLREIAAATRKHPHFKRADENFKHNSGFRYSMQNKNDHDREFLMTVLAFDVPISGSGRTLKHKDNAAASVAVEPNAVIAEVSALP